MTPPDCTPPMTLPATPQPKFDTFYKYDALTRLLFDFSESNPHIASLQSIGKSHEGRDIWVMALTNAATGIDTDKPAFWTDGNIHAAELTSPSDRVAVVVTEPLTRDEAWVAFTPGEIRVYVDGAPAAG